MKMNQGYLTCVIFLNSPLGPNFFHSTSLERTKTLLHHPKSFLSTTHGDPVWYRGSNPVPPCMLRSLSYLPAQWASGHFLKEIYLCIYLRVREHEPEHHSGTCYVEHGDLCFYSTLQPLCHFVGCSIRTFLRISGDTPVQPRRTADSQLPEVTATCSTLAPVSSETIWGKKAKNLTALHCDRTEIQAS